ncbi:Ppx/GppA phosphatase family protein [Maritalea porphyrae]|uniref:Ppx/GppA phosphatase family protein n=1 Tax=Maritalea porphyrae TaxID=880732 RepID=UPI0022AE6A86|nr:Ppx/GppA phosphatase family protein [Maritalea porphyrae]MCZ4271002.1 Ppx/GppA phosphatase family protein [Maritalea porphyrae]
MVDENRPVIGAKKQSSSAPEDRPVSNADRSNVPKNPANAQAANKKRARKRNTKSHHNSVQTHQRPELYGALDLGTNNCRLLLARPTASGFKVVDGFSRIVRLGEGLTSTGRLSDDAMDRTIEALQACKVKIENQNVTKFRLIATEACRSADNAESFLARIESETGIVLEVVDRQTEAQLAVTGCADLVEPGVAGSIIFDIGGGSSELAWLDFRGGRPKSPGKMASSIRSWQSLPVGVVSIAEKFDGVNVTPESFEEMVAYVASHLKKFRGREKLKQTLAEHPMHLVGTSGTVTTLAGLHLGLDRYDRSKVDGLWMRSEQVEDTMRVLINMDYERRKANPCIGRDRADLVLPGCAIFEAIRREWPCDRIRVADRGLREGILISLMSQDRVWSKPNVGAQRRRRRTKPTQQNSNQRTVS